MDAAKRINLKVKQQKNHRGGGLSVELAGAKLPKFN
jgi:hypothetical protein